MTIRLLPTVIAAAELAHDDPESGIDLERWQQLALDVLRTEGVGGGELNLMFVNEATMTELNAQHMGGDGPTDVLAFPIDGDDIVDDGVPALLGDVVICPGVARRYAASHGVRQDNELALLVVHGVLHVLGHDHAEPDETARMKEREQALLDAHHRS